MGKHLTNKQPITQEVPHFCLRCGNYLGDYVPLTEEEKDQYNTLQVCTRCFYEMYPQYRMTDEQWERMKQRIASKKALKDVEPPIRDYI